MFYPLNGLRLPLISALRLVAAASVVVVLAAIPGLVRGASPLRGEAVSVQSGSRARLSRTSFSAISITARLIPAVSTSSSSGIAV